MTDRPIHRAICMLTKLQVLHLYGLGSADMSEYDTITLGSTKSLKDVVCTAVVRTPGYLRRAIQAAEARLEVLMLRDIASEDQAFDLVPFSWPQTPGAKSEQRERGLSVQPHSRIAFARLSHLNIATKMSDSAIEILASVLHHLDLIHFGTGRHSRTLLQHVRMRSLKSLAVSLMHEDDIQAFVDHFLLKFEVSQLDSLMIECNFPIHIHLEGLLRRFPLKRLFMCMADVYAMKAILESLNFTRLRVLSIFCKEYGWETEKKLAFRAGEFKEDFVVELGYSRYWVHQDVFVEGSRSAESFTYPKLSRDRVHLHTSDHEREHLRFLQSTLPSYTY